MSDYIAAMDEALSIISDQWLIREKSRNTEPGLDDFEYQRTRHLTLRVFPKVQKLEQALVIFAMMEHLFLEAAPRIKSATGSEYVFHKLERMSVAESFIYYLEAVLDLDTSVFSAALKRKIRHCRVIRNHLVHEGLDATGLSKSVKGAIDQFGGITVEDFSLDIQSSFIDRAADVLYEIDDALLQLELENMDFTKSAPVNS